MILHGFPVAKTLGGTSLDTTEPAPITAPFPIFTPFKIVQFPPIQTLLPIMISLVISLLETLLY
jgi:hypothetical protein